jgi:hypothetical protein
LLVVAVGALEKLGEQLVRGDVPAPEALEIFGGIDAPSSRSRRAPRGRRRRA